MSSRVTATNGPIELSEMTIERKKEIKAGKTWHKTPKVWEQNKKKKKRRRKKRRLEEEDINVFYTFWPAVEHRFPSSTEVDIATDVDDVWESDWVMTPTDVDTTCWLGFYTSYNHHHYYHHQHHHHHHHRHCRVISDNRCASPSALATSCIHNTDDIVSASL